MTEELQVSTSPQQPSSWAAEVDQMSPIEKSPPISIIPEPAADQVVEETPKPAQVENSVSVVEESEPKVVVVVVEEAEKKQIIMESSSGPEGGDSIVESKEAEEVKEQVSNNLESSVKAN